MSEINPKFRLIMKRKSKPDMSVARKMTEFSVAKGKKGRKNFLQEMREEMRRVSWTTKEELISCTKIVIGAIFVLGLGIYVIDLFIRNVLLGISSLLHIVTG
jgi:preprotein translocase subunit SecE